MNIVPNERRKTYRRKNDDCSQCVIYTFEIDRLKHDFEDMVRKNGSTIENLNLRIDKMLPRWVFIVVVGIYLGLAVFNSLQIRNMSVDVGKLQTNVDAVKENVFDLKNHKKYHIE